MITMMMNSIQVNLDIIMRTHDYDNEDNDEVDHNDDDDGDDNHDDEDHDND